MNNHDHNNGNCGNPECERNKREYLRTIEEQQEIIGLRDARIAELNTTVRVREAEKRRLEERIRELQSRPGKHTQRVSFLNPY